MKKLIAIIVYIVISSTHVLSMNNKQHSKKDSDDEKDIIVYQRIIYHLPKDLQGVLYHKTLQKNKNLLRGNYIQASKIQEYNIGNGFIRASENLNTLSFLKTNTNTQDPPFRFSFYLRYFPFKEYIFYGETKTRSFFTQHDKEQDSLFDGPNDNKLLLIGINNKRLNRAECSLKMADNAACLVYPSSYITALALTKNQNRFALCTDNRQEEQNKKNLYIYDYDIAKKEREIYAEITLSMILKKNSLLV